MAEFFSQTALEFVLRLPCSSSAPQAREALTDENWNLDLTLGVLIGRRSTRRAPTDG
jgi:hypothetical protein